MSTTIRFRMSEGADDLAPSKAHSDDAGFDLRAREAVALEPGQRAMVPSGLFLELPEGWEGQVRPRSGLAAKKGITILNAPGTIDAGYRGEVCVILYNTGSEILEIARGDRIAQLVIQQLPEVSLVPADRLNDSHRGAGGFGSTGVN